MAYGVRDKVKRIAKGQIMTHITSFEQLRERLPEPTGPTRLKVRDQLSEQSVAFVRRRAKDRRTGGRKYLPENL